MGEYSDLLKVANANEFAQGEQVVMLEVFAVLAPPEIASVVVMHRWMKLLRNDHDPHAFGTNVAGNPVSASDEKIGIFRNLEDLVNGLGDLCQERIVVRTNFKCPESVTWPRTVLLSNPSCHTGPSWVARTRSGYAFCHSVCAALTG